MCGESLGVIPGVPPVRAPWLLIAMDWQIGVTAEREAPEEASPSAPEGGLMRAAKAARLLKAT